MKYLLIILFSFNVFADARTDALNIRFDAIKDMKLAMEFCEFNYPSEYYMKKAMINASDNSMLGCLESKKQDVDDFIENQDKGDDNAKEARLFFKTADCEAEQGAMIKNMCLIFQKGQ